MTDNAEVRNQWEANMRQIFTQTSQEGQGDAVKPKQVKSLVPESEDALQTKAIELLHLHGYIVAHFRPAQIIRNGETSWRTPVSADGAGFPDLCAVGKNILFIECKSEKGIISTDQQAWLAALRMAGVKTFVLYPHTWDEFERWVRE
jgi:hypothetical protein